MIEKTTVKAGDVVRHFDGRMWISAEHHKAAIEQAYENGKAVGVATERKAVENFLMELHEQAGNRHNHYHCAATLLREKGKA